MELNRRYTLMAFPQGFDGAKLRLNIVLIPRNRNPFDPLDTGLPGTPTVTPFADVKPQFQAGIVRGTDEFPWSNAAPPREPVFRPLVVADTPQKADLLRAIEGEFGGKITSVRTGADKAEPVRSVETSVFKYLPATYRNAFNFTTARHPNAHTDDSYACAVREAKPQVKNFNSPDEVSWGQVFGYILRQPLLANACGMVYETELDVEPDWFVKGGYLYVDLINDDYAEAQKVSLESAGGAFAKRYAARIPKLRMGTARPVFAPLLFPVMYKKAIDPADPEPPKAPWDEIFAEVGEYNDGFAKIVHANQPVSRNLLAEQADGFQPVNDVGIRLGWDDEQLLIWYVRQLSENPASPGSGERVDAPLGVFGYRIDVRANAPGTDWECLNTVQVGREAVGATPVGNAGGEQLDLPFQVYPTQLTNDKTGPYWLPMYYANWVGKSVVQKDTDAARIYQNEGDKTRPADNAQRFTSVGPNTALRYGQSYQFRVRLMDLSGGGPGIGQSTFRAAPSARTTVDFKRFIAPGLLRLDKPQHLLDSKDQLFNEAAPDVFDSNPKLTVRRPVLGYPAVVFTGKYQAIGQDPVELLATQPTIITNPDNADTQVEIGIADPDVTKVEIWVEVESLGMDNRDSRTGEEHYLPLYRTERPFAGDFEEILPVPIEFRDVNALLFDRINPFGDPALDLNAGPLVLPSARRVRLTMRSVCDGDNVYFGNTEPELDSRLGQTTQIFLYHPSAVESGLLQPAPNVPPVQALYLQPDARPINDGNIETLLFSRSVSETQPDVVQRLAHELGLEAKGLTLVGKKGERVVFGCNNRIRHSLAPDHSSITFASKGDLAQHWLGCMTYRLNRDWAWDGLEPTSFTIERRKKFRHDTDGEAEAGVVGEWELKHTASFEAQQEDRFGLVNREHTLLVFIDAIEPKTALKQLNGTLRFPDELDVQYALTAHLKPDYPASDFAQPDSLQLPTTTNPAQVPTLASAGMAFSPYRKDEDRYRSTEVRQRYLWLEFTEPVADPNDTLFCRVLANAPDQLLSHNGWELLAAPTESSLNLDPEFIRIITPGQSDDLAGIGAMQPMTKAEDSDRHYLVPLPPGLHAESPDLFGFFTYEIRVGHGHWSDRPDNLWSTAQGRFGRPLRVTGVQHPAPNLLCLVNRDDKQLYVSAPYAQAVTNGRNVTANPPRTQLWCLLYAQVQQADGRAYRNILLDEKRLDWRKRLFLTERDATIRREFLTISRERRTLTAKQVKRGVTDETRFAGEQLAVLKDQPKTGSVSWTNREVIDRLELLGLPTDASLSVVVVEVFGKTTNIYDHMTDLNNPNRNRTDAVGVVEKHNAVNAPVNIRRVEARQRDTLTAVEEARRVAEPEAVRVAEKISPLSSGLGHYRILRTSPLTPVPFVCCTDC